MNMTVKDVERLTKIMNRTRKLRIKLKISKRISNETFNYFQDYSKDANKQGKIPWGSS